MAWRIHKAIDFCYGHRVFTQRLIEEYALSAKCTCRHPHGHQGKVSIHLSGELDDTGMVTDFRNLGWLKAFIDENLDHHFIVGAGDPLAESMLWGKALVPVRIDDHLVGWTVDLNDTEEGTPEYEYLEGFFVVDFVPTSEKLSQWIYQIAQYKMAQIGVKVDRVEFWETPKSCSVYEV